MTASTVTFHASSYVSSAVHACGRPLLEAVASLPVEVRFALSARQDELPLLAALSADGVVLVLPEPPPPASHMEQWFQQFWPVK